MRNNHIIPGVLGCSTAKPAADEGCERSWSCISKKEKLEGADSGGESVLQIQLSALQCGMV